MRISAPSARSAAGLAALLVAIALASAPAPSLSRPVPVARAVATLELPAELRHGEDVSGIVLRPPFMLLAVDEGRKIQVLREQRPRVYEIVETQELLAGPEDEELDLEGLAASGAFVYALGSHSRKRKAVDGAGRKASKNRERLFETSIEPARGYLFRFTVRDLGQIRKRGIKRVTLHDLFARHPILRPFQAVPGKENGIDIEGIAAGRRDEIYVGFRGPVLRGGYVPVLIIRPVAKGRELEIEHDVRRDMRFVHLGGRGVRDLVRVPAAGDEQRWLILAGPMSDGPISYQVYEWDGEHTVPGRDEPDAREHAWLQCEIPPPAGHPNAKAEGIALLEASADELEFVIVYDSAPRGAPTVFTCPRTAGPG